MIVRRDVPPGSAFRSVYYPWNLFFNHTSIKKKIDNYAFIRCDLHLKFVINASPFYYGAFIGAYRPLGTELNSSPIDYNNSEWRVNLSQRPHVFMYPQNSQGGEMICPFVATTEWLKIGGDNSSTNLTKFGELTLANYVELAYASDAVASDIDISVYAWAENVELAGLTVDLAVQSRDMSPGEYKRNGVISKPASAVARAAGMLGSLPGIGPFATATSIGADAVAGIASLFGYTKVPSVEDTLPTKNLPFRALAVSDISDATEKLSVDSKNELTINNQCIGDPKNDNLLISDFVQRSSFLTTFTWTAAQAANTRLWNSYVSPYMSAVVAGTGQDIIYATPMWVVSNMFEFWRGDIIFDFKIICSQYHRGRLRFSWDPIGDIANTTDATTEVYNHIVDITHGTNVSIRVPYNQRVGYCKVPSDVTATIFNTTALAKDDSDTVNGILTVRVLNEQTSPVASADITVMVSVRGAENMEFAGPKEVNNQLSCFTVQSGDLDPDDVDFTDFGGPSSTDPNLNLVYMGEKVSSMRELLQRANLHTVFYTTEEATGTTLSNQYINRRPIYPGYDLNGIYTATGIVSTTPEPYNFVKPCPYHLIAPCFLGERGSFSWHINVDGFEPMSCTIARSREIKTAAKYLLVNTTLLTNPSMPAALITQNIATNCGAALINQRTNTGLSACVPMYSQKTMLDTNPDSRTLGLTGYSVDDTVQVSILNKESKEGTTDIYFVEHWFNAGPDHSLVYFLNVPTFYHYNSVPVSVASP